MSRSLTKIKTHGECNKQFLSSEFMSKDMNCSLCLKYKDKLISLKNFNSSFIDGRTNFWKTAAKNHCISDMHDETIRLQEESIVNTFEKKVKKNLTPTGHKKIEDSFRNLGVIFNQKFLDLRQLF